MRSSVDYSYYCATNALLSVRCFILMSRRNRLCRRYEKLQRWDEALEAYERRIGREAPGSVEYHRWGPLHCLQLYQACWWLCAACWLLYAAVL